MILLDTHIWVNWIVKGNGGLVSAVVEAVQEADSLAVSAISCFEVSLLVKRGKLELPLPVDEWLLEALVNSGVDSLPVTCDITHRAVGLPDVHRDPADGIIIATALIHEIKLASMDSVFSIYHEITGQLVGEGKMEQGGHYVASLIMLRDCEGVCRMIPSPHCPCVGHSTVSKPMVL